MRKRRVAAPIAFLIAVLSVVAGAQQTTPSSLAPSSLRDWLSMIASDDFEGRETFSEGLALAASYIADRLRESGVKPAGDRGLYFQRVSVLDVRSSNRSTVTVEVKGQTRTFRNGQGVTFPSDVGGKRTLILDDVEFVGYGIDAGTSHNDYRGLNMKGKVAVWLGSTTPSSVDQKQSERLLRNREALAIEEMGAAASISLAPIPAPPLTDSSVASGVRGIFTTSQRLDSARAPSIAGDDAFYEFLFSGSAIKFDDLKARSQRRQDIAPFRLEGVKVTFNLDADYQVVRTQYTRNVVGIVEGSDPRLRDTYVALGAHYDHLGYAQSAPGPDRIFNGADDDGTGVAALIGLARAFATGPRPRRSLLFVWHAGEEKGLYGSKYFVDYPVVPLDQIVAQLNIDMIGRNRNNDPAESNVFYAVGSDRISSELHNILMEANAASSKPFRIDFELNDSQDPERFYYRSDHYSYASRGIPVIFFFTGVHPDYHQVTDSVDRIDFDKMSRIANLVYDVARRLANLDHVPARDFRGPRLGKGSKGKLPAN
ncbi:MAG TPA: M28 family peptidase [Terriglobia bacterium]|nr:M28 family peptidase [Terriglobia bacterium]